MNMINRIVLVGNGFDLAHGLKTSYEHFINWYWEQKAHIFLDHPDKIDDILFTLNYSDIRNSRDTYNQLKKNGEITVSDFHTFILSNRYGFTAKYSPFFSNIIKGIETKGWVDIENEYYRFLKQYALSNQENKAAVLNRELLYIQELLVRYLDTLDHKDLDIKENIMNAIYAPINGNDVSIGAKKEWEELIDFLKSKDESDWYFKLHRYGINGEDEMSKYIDEAKEYKQVFKGLRPVPALFRLPDRIMLLSFNYTNVVQSYLKPGNNSFTVNQIHGQLDNPDSVIFGYGDEMDEQFKQIRNLNVQEYLRNVKSINYLNSDNYRKLLSFIDSAPFQVCIMGHSCGNSDRTLLNTLFEHKNCISIKPYYHIEKGSDNYLEIIQNISRNFNDMKLMRDRVVNKTYCESMD